MNVHVHRGHPVVAARRVAAVRPPRAVRMLVLSLTATAAAMTVLERLAHRIGG
jgi:hypothetical protein